MIDEGSIKKIKNIVAQIEKEESVLCGIPVKGTSYRICTVDEGQAEDSIEVMLVDSNGDYIGLTEYPLSKFKE